MAERVMGNRIPVKIDVVLSLSTSRFERQGHTIDRKMVSVS